MTACWLCIRCACPRPSSLVFPTAYYNRGEVAGTHNFKKCSPELKEFVAAGRKQTAANFIYDQFLRTTSIVFLLLFSCPTVDDVQELGSSSSSNQSAKSTSSPKWLRPQKGYKDPAQRKWANLVLAPQGRTHYSAQMANDSRRLERSTQTCCFWKTKKLDPGMS